MTILQGSYFLPSYRGQSRGSLQSGQEAELLTQRHRLETACSDQELLTSTIKHRDTDTEGLLSNLLDTGSLGVEVFDLQFGQGGQVT